MHGLLRTSVTSRPTRLSKICAPPDDLAKIRTTPASKAVRMLSTRLHGRITSRNRIGKNLGGLKELLQEGGYWPALPLRGARNAPGFGTTFIYSSKPWAIAQGAYKLFLNRLRWALYWVYGSSTVSWVSSPNYWPNY